MQPGGSITLYLAHLRAGDTAAARQLWEGYFQRMVDLARQKLRGISRRAADEEDVALSAFKSFCEGVRRGRFPQLTDRHNLWPLLVAITLHKSVDLVRRESRQKRGGAGALQAADLDALLGREPTPDLVAQMAEQLQHLLARLDATGDPDLRRIALWRM